VKYTGAKSAGHCICQTPETGKGKNVAGEGQLSVFGLTVPPKEEKKG